MRFPTQASNRSFATLGSGLAMLGAGVIFFEDGPPWLIALILLAGVLITFAGFGFSLVYGHVAYRHRRLLSGKDSLARWRVGPDRWAAFRAFEERLGSAGAKPVNILDLRPGAAPAEGVDVLVGREAIMVDGDMHALALDDIPTVVGARTVFGPPLCIEIVLNSPSDSESIDVVLRFPVGAGADAAAARALAFYVARAATK